MNTIGLLAGIGFLGAAVLMLRMARQDILNKGLIEALGMTPVGRLKSGLNLTCGEVVCENPIKTPYTETPAVWYKYQATKRAVKRPGHGVIDDGNLGSGSLNCPFFIRDNTGEIEVMGKGGEVPTFPHTKLLKSQSGVSASLKDRMKKLKEIDRANQSEKGKKPFFRKIDGAEGIPLDIPTDLIEMDENSEEARKANKQYRESYIQNGDHVYILGTLVKADASASSKIVKAGKRGPLIVSCNAEDLDPSRFQSNFIVGLLFGAGFALLGVVLFLIGVGVVEV